MSRPDLRHLSLGNFAPSASSSSSIHEQQPEGQPTRRSTIAGSIFSTTTFDTNDTIDRIGPLGLTTLHDPALLGRPVVAELVFVHGLGGGSRKTWTDDRAGHHHYWPQAWLPDDADFDDVRIHTFGYRSSWAEQQQSFLRISDFAQSLVGELRNSPEIRRSSTRIVMVCHSMGGCVAKKAYLLLHDDPACRHELAPRVHSLFFLGTPHRGSDLASVLKTVSLVAWGHKAFVRDLTPDSAALVDISEAFRHCASKLHIWTFFETLQTGMRPFNKMVVPRSSAVLGLPGEQIVAMNADHRHLCKFESPADSNYRSLRNALLTAVDDIRAQQNPSLSLGLGLGQSPPSPRSQLDAAPSMFPPPPFPSADPVDRLDRLKRLLDVDDTPEDMLEALKLVQEPGSCQWFTKHADYRAWRSQGPPLLWLTGRPASGKSVLSNHIACQLQADGVFCSYFFFRQREATKSTLSDCFRSLVLQMARQDSQVADRLLQRDAEGLAAWDNGDDMSVWKKLIVGVVFHTPLPSTVEHVWIIDGVDECANYSSLFTKKMLAGLPPRLRLFATSRQSNGIVSGLAALKPGLCRHAVLTEADTLADMRLLATSRLQALHRFEADKAGEAAAAAMCERLLAKSSGSFLWLRLMLDEFGNVWTIEAMESVLGEVPADLQRMYSHMIDRMALEHHKARQARTILRWVVLACRPLTVSELRDAVRLDLHETLQNPREAIPSLCQQLVLVGSNDKVQILHETARDFLLHGCTHVDYPIQGPAEHARISSLLLRFLSSSSAFQPHVAPRPRTRGFARQTAVAAPEPLLDYAAAFFSEHMYRCTSDDDALMDDLCVFLQGRSILAWIEHAARRRMLGVINQTAANLRGYLARRRKYLAPMNPSLALMDAWVTDLIRVTAKFQAQLLTCPASIHHTIPALCPSDSAIAQTFAALSKAAAPHGKQPPPSITVRGKVPRMWDDCLTNLEFQGRPAKLVHGALFFAVGMLPVNDVVVFDPHSLERVATVVHPGTVQTLAFSNDGGLLVTAGAGTLVVWQAKSGEQIASLTLPSKPLVTTPFKLLAVTFLDDAEILCVQESGDMTKWNLYTDDCQTLSWHDDDDDKAALPTQPPRCAVFSTTDGDGGALLAVGYRSFPVLVWDAVDMELLGQCPANSYNGIDDMAFNPSPDMSVLAVSHADGTLQLYDYSLRHAAASYVAGQARPSLESTFKAADVFANSLCCSPNGRNLITGSSDGEISVYEFDQDDCDRTVLMRVYIISTLGDSIRGLSCAPDSLRFFGLQGQQCRAWAPTALVHKDYDLESVSDSFVKTHEARSVDEVDTPDITTTLAVSAQGMWAVAGKNNGTVVLFSAVDGTERGVLYSHGRGVSVVHVALGEAGDFVVSADNGGCVLVVALGVSLREASVEKDADQQPPADRIRLAYESGAAVVGLLVSPSADRLLVRTRVEDVLWDPTAGGRRIGTLAYSVGGGAQPTFSRSVFQHVDRPDWFVLVLADRARVIAWHDCAEQTSIPLQWPSARPPTATSSFHLGRDFVIEVVRASLFVPPRIYLWPASAFALPDGASPPTMQSPVEIDTRILGGPALTVLGIHDRSTVLVVVDARLWVYSLELPSGAQPCAVMKPTRAKRHFFALSEWRMLDGDLRCLPVQRPGGLDFVVATKHRVLVVEGGLRVCEDV